MYKTLSKEGFM